MGHHQAFRNKGERVLIYEDSELHVDQRFTLLELMFRNYRRLLCNELMFGVKNVQHMRE